MYIGVVINRFDKIVKYNTDRDKDRFNNFPLKKKKKKRYRP